MTSESIRRIGVPLAVAVLVLAVVAGIGWAARDGGSGTNGATPGSVGSAPAGDGSSGDSGAVSSPLPADPSAGSPVAPAPDPTGPRSQFTAVTAGPDGRSIDLTFWGGVEDCYRYTVRAQETPESVTLLLTQKSTSTGACIDLAQQYDRTVRLDEPLGSRSVVDAKTDEVLLAPSP
jgi:hypothetical protein